uniref:SH2 domain-containing protein n=1 Tax=Trichuris muris TaxID=70415 RepID=A0A5S6QQS1_TRIMR
MDVSCSSEVDLAGSLSTGDLYSDSETCPLHVVSDSSLTPTSSSELSTASEGTNELLTLQTPQCPLGELSFYHGFGRRDTLRERLLTAGDFLLFCDSENGNKPSLLVLSHGCNSVGVFAFEQNEEGRFFVQQENQPAVSFSTVGQAALSYKRWGTMLQDHTVDGLNLYVLVREIVDPLYERMHSFGAAGIHWTYLPYYHGHLPYDQAASQLERNGDFLLLAADCRHLLRLFVLWDNKTKMLKIKLQPNSGHYALPRTSRLQPVEIVSSVEEYIKAVVVGQCVLDDCILKRPVDCAIIRRAEYRCRECLVEALDSQQGVPKVILRPLCSLPYYHGEQRDPYKLKYQFVAVGDYAVYFSTSTKCLILLVCHQFNSQGPTDIACFSICRTQEGMFHLERHCPKRSFNTVSELVDFYVNNRRKLETTLYGKSVRLVKPVKRDDLLRNESVAQSSLQMLPYFFPIEQMSACGYMFEREGDFMVNQRSGGSSPSVGVLVKDQVKVVELSSVERNGRYRLSRGHEAEPFEWVNGVDEFLKSSIVHGIPIFGILPRTAVLRDSKVQRARRPKLGKKREQRRIMNRL